MERPELMTFRVKLMEVYASEYDVDARSPEEALVIARDSSLQTRYNTTLRSRKFFGFLDSGEVRDILPDGSDPVLIEAS